MSIATVWFKAKLFFPPGKDGVDPEGLMSAFARSVCRESYIAIDPVQKTVIANIGCRRLIFLNEDNIEMANWEAWHAGVKWAKSYIRTGYGADEKPWDDIPVEKRRNR